MLLFCNSVDSGVLFLPIIHTKFTCTELVVEVVTGIVVTLAELAAVPFRWVARGDRVAVTHATQTLTVAWTHFTCVCPGIQTPSNEYNQMVLRQILWPKVRNFYAKHSFARPQCWHPLKNGSRVSVLTLCRQRHNLHCWGWSHHTRTPCRNAPCCMYMLHTQRFHSYCIGRCWLPITKSHCHQRVWVGIVTVPTENYPLTIWFTGHGEAL